MNRQATTGILAIAACGLVMWVLRSGMNRAPEPGPGGNVSATVLAAPKTPKSTTLAPEDPEANGYGSISGQVVLEGEFPNLPPLLRAGDGRLKPEDRVFMTIEIVPASK
jgi:hypothetical protein